MSMIKEFKEFALRGNVMDMAIGVIIGAAFATIINSAINDLILPIVGKFVGNVDFTNLYVPLSEKIQKLNGQWPALADARKLGAVFAYGNFLTVLLNFTILAFCIFTMVKTINSLKKKDASGAALPVPPSREERLLSEIRDLLKVRTTDVHRV